jgi:hypothetical protein
MILKDHIMIIVHLYKRKIIFYYKNIQIILKIWSKFSLLKINTNYTVPH